MACFVVPAAEALVVTAAAFILQKKEAAKPVKVVETDDPNGAVKTAFSRKLKWLRTLLFGGALLLAYEHVWHGEVVPWFPFLTAAADPGDAAEMLHEMATVGVTMAVLITVVWVGMVVVSNIIEKRAVKLQPRSEEGNA